MVSVDQCIIDENEVTLLSGFGIDSGIIVDEIATRVLNRPNPSLRVLLIWSEISEWTDLRKAEEWIRLNSSWVRDVVIARCADELVEAPSFRGFGRLLDLFGSGGTAIVTFSEESAGDHSSPNDVVSPTQIIHHMLPPDLKLPAKITRFYEGTQRMWDERKALKDEREALGKEREALRVERRILTEENTRLNSALAISGAQQHLLKAERTHAETRCADLRHDLDLLRESNRKVDEELKTVKLALQDRDDENAKLRSQLSLAEADMETHTRKKIRLLEESVSQAKENEEKYMLQVERLLEEKDQSREEEKKKNERVAQLESRVRKLEADLNAGRPWYKLEKLVKRE
ncbi:hypothetical protein CC1G_11209 [Coprinopsis cinerea okayama7|uniref:Uncharacterized protein n=1 Tax=Coprinopsis cinerea (strain Okayama-7 / 130 / ATCC MYA-4618 / FGSC 9003) TaxID=240176 RepID=A8NJU3_COPC7|nr:hypothetical protein CC1G_11209 [Coprinopsis cinerea okayama7\|eukprot:XP_001834296.1 hypothetical protein CC1G_11209 [Coprinopsis cinerea okayama7\